jgi:hypothetical protein
LLEVTPEHEVVWEFINPYLERFFGKIANNSIYRAYRIPYEWVPQLSKPQEVEVEPLDVAHFRVPGSVDGVGKGTITLVDGVDPDRKEKEKQAARARHQETVNFCTVTLTSEDVK